MASFSGKINTKLKAYDPDAAVAAWELKPNILTARKIGTPGANVASEIHNGIAGLRITTEDVAVSTWAAQVEHDAAYAINTAATAAINLDFARSINLDFTFNANYDLTVTVDTPYTAAINMAGNMDATETALTYDTGSGAKTAVPFYIKIESEIMRVDGDTGTVFTVVRAQGGTTGATHVHTTAIATTISTETVLMPITVTAGTIAALPATILLGTELMTVTAVNAAIYTVTRGVDSTTAAEHADNAAGAATMGVSDTELPYDGGGGTIAALPAEVKIGTEVLTVTADSGTVLTVTRGVDSTTAAQHADNAAGISVAGKTRVLLPYDGAGGTAAALPFTIKIGTEFLSVTADSGTVLTVTRGFESSTAAEVADNATFASVAGTTQTEIPFNTLANTHPPVPYTILIGTERMQVTAATSTVWTVTRGYDGSTAADHADNAASSTVVGAADTTLHVDGETGQIPTTDYTLLIGTESVFVDVSAGTSTKLIVTRAADGTTAATAVNNATLTQAGIGIVDTQLNVDTITGTIPATFPFNVLVGTELFQVTAFSTPVLTVTRGFDGTTAAVHLDNAVVDVSVAADDITDQYTAGAVIAGVTFKTADGEDAPA